MSDFSIRRGYSFRRQFDSKAAMLSYVSDANRREEALEDGLWLLTSSATSQLPSGDYLYELAGSDGEYLGGGGFSVLRTAKAEGEVAIVQTFEERALELVEEALLTASGSGEISFGVDGGSFTYETRADLLAYREYLRSRIAKGNRVGARFSC